MAVVLSDLLDEKQIELELHASTRDEALREIVDLFRESGKVSDAEKFLDAVIAREQSASTLAEHGVAFPHARTDLVKEIVLGIGRSNGRYSLRRRIRRTSSSHFPHRRAEADDPGLSRLCRNTCAAGQR